MKRRSALKVMALAATAPTLGSCARLFAGASAVPSRRFRLAPVRVEPGRVIREVVGLRPYRKSGFRVEAVPLGDKTLVHNYGHGGGGISLSWGSAALAAELALATPHRRA